MEGDHRYDCCICEGAGTGPPGRHRERALLPRRREARLLRMAQLLVAGLLLATAGSLAVLFTVGLRGRCAGTEAQQVKEDLSSMSVDISGKPKTSKLQGDRVVEKPSALMTAPHQRMADGNRLNWDNKTGDVFCRGGFRCSIRDLVVPRKGIYRVFLQITWLRETCPRDELDLSVDVIVFSSTYPKDRVVLSMVDTTSCRSYLTKSLFGSRFVNLDTGSRLHVTSTFPELISSDARQVFFGAELTDESPE